jgi:molybdate transport system substrate-binding protein
VPTTDTPEALTAVLRAARGIYFPDPLKATAGIHFMKVLQTLGLDGDAGRPPAAPTRTAQQPWPSMAQRATSPGLIGCTQVTEILFAPGVELSRPAARGSLSWPRSTPPRCAHARRTRQTAAAFIALLASDGAAALRSAGRV